MKKGEKISSKSYLLTEIRRLIKILEETDQILKAIIAENKKYLSSKKSLQVVDS